MPHEPLADEELCRRVFELAHLRPTEVHTLLKETFGALSLQKVKRLLRCAQEAGPDTEHAVDKVTGLQDVSMGMKLEPDMDPDQLKEVLRSAACKVAASEAQEQGLDIIARTRKVSEIIGPGCFWVRFGSVRDIVQASPEPLKVIAFLSKCFKDGQQEYDAIEFCSGGSVGSPVRPETSHFKACPVPEASVSGSVIWMPKGRVTEALLSATDYSDEALELLSTYDSTRQCPIVGEVVASPSNTQLISLGWIRADTSSELANHGVSFEEDVLPLGPWPSHQDPQHRKQQVERAAKRRVMMVLQCLPGHLTTYDFVRFLRPQCIRSGADSGKLVDISGEDFSEDIHTICSRAVPTCSHCGQFGGDLKTCSGCRAVKYCSSRCQSKHWKARHKNECSLANRMLLAGSNSVTMMCMFGGPSVLSDLIPVGNSSMPIAEDVLNLLESMDLYHPSSEYADQLLPQLGQFISNKLILTPCDKWPQNQPGPKHSQFTELSEDWLNSAGSQAASDLFNNWAEEIMECVIRPLLQGYHQHIPSLPEWKEQRALDGDPQSQYQFALLSQHKGRESEAAHWAEKAALQGYADAQNLLGGFYVCGVGVAVDGALAVKWFEKASLQGHACAMLNFAETHRDPALAASWMLKAAAKGLALAQFKCGELFEAGRGMSADEAVAASWFLEAAKNALADQSTTTRAEDQADVSSVKSNACYKLALMYMEGRGVAQNSETSFKWCHRAAKEGHPLAQTALARRLERGVGADKDEESAKTWYRRAAANGEPQAKCRLEDMHFARK